MLLKKRDWIFLFVLLFLCANLSACSDQTLPPEQDIYRVQKNASTGKKVVILLVDSLLSDSLERLVVNNQTPALAFFLKNGVYSRDLISSFPTMSVTIDGTLLTGTYADEHHLPGLLWFNQAERRIVDYGDGLRVVLNPGLQQWFSDSFYNLSQRHLSKEVRTIHETLHESGLTSASINSLVYRGDITHQVGINGAFSVSLKGPDLLALGAASKVTDARLPIGPFESLGMNSKYTIQSLISLVRENRLPDVTFAYFPDMDGELHKHGPNYEEGILELDRQLQQFLNVFGDWDRAFEQHIFLIMGDSGVTATSRNRRTALIDLEKAFADFRLYRLGSKQSPADDVAIAVNGRMSYVYALSSRVAIRNIVDRVKQDQRIDVIAWRENGWIHVAQGNRLLQYRRGSQLTDRFGQRWDLNGDREILDITVDTKDGRLDSQLYPDGLRRLESVFSSHQGRFLVLTAKPGAEFAADEAPNHVGGGNHGSLHRSDSIVPLIVAPADVVPPPPSRMVELKQYILSLVESQRKR